MMYYSYEQMSALLEKVYQKGMADGLKYFSHQKRDDESIADFVSRSEEDIENRHWLDQRNILQFLLEADESKDE